MAKPNLSASLKSNQASSLVAKQSVHAIYYQEDKNKMSSTNLETDCERNSWITPGYDSVKMLTNLIQQVNGSGGPIDQTHLYIDLKSTSDWLSISNHEDYITASNDMPLDDAVNAIQDQLKSSPHLKQQSLDIIALGPGNGYTEVKLIKKLRKLTSIYNVRLYLLDISEHLVIHAYNYASSAFAAEPNVQIIPITGDFRKLYQYKRLLSMSKNANHLLVVTMLGYTFGNLENERRFILDSLNAFPTGSFFLFDLGLTFAPADQKEEVKKKDPWLSGHARWQEATEQFLEGPIRRYRNGIKTEDKIKFRAALDHSRCPISKSYCVELIATLPDGTEFPMRYFKRYEQASLAKDMKEDGWDTLDAWYYSENKGLLQLARRQ